MIIGANIDKHADGCEKRDGNQTGLRQFVKCPHQWPEDPRYLRVPHAPAQPSPGKMNKKCKKDLVGKVFIGFYLEKPSFHKRWNPYCCLTWLSSCYANVRWQCTLRYSSSFRSPTQLYWMLLEMLIHVHTYIGPQHAFPFNRMDWPGLTCQWIPVHWGRLGPAGLRIPPTGPQLLLYTSTSWYS